MAGPFAIEEAKQMSSKLERTSVDHDAAVDILSNLLSKEVPVKVFLGTNLAQTVKALRTSSNTKVVELARSLTAKWRLQVAEMSTQRISTTARTPTPISARSKAPNSARTVPKAHTGARTPTPKSARTPTPTSACTPAAKPVRRRLRNDSKRDPVRHLLAQALSAEGGDGEAARELAVEIEERLYRNLGGPSEEYRAQVKSLKFNLTDPKNPDFRAHVLRGTIKPEWMPRLTSGQMAGKEGIDPETADREATMVHPDLKFLSGQREGDDEEE